MIRRFSPALFGALAGLSVAIGFRLGVGEAAFSKVSNLLRDDSGMMFLLPAIIPVVFFALRQRAAGILAGLCVAALIATALYNIAEFNKVNVSDRWRLQTGQPLGLAHLAATTLGNFPDLHVNTALVENFSGKTLVLSTESGGILPMDRIGSLPMDIQISNRPIKATKADLERAEREGLMLQGTYRKFFIFLDPAEAAYVCLTRVGEDALLFPSLDKACELK